MLYQSIFITGASSGIGQALAIAFAKAGTTLFLCGRNQTNLNKTADLIRPKGAQVYIFIFDITNTKETAFYMEKANSICPLDLIIANAGVSAGMLNDKNITSVSQTLFQTNIFGVINTVLPAIQILQHNKQGHLVLMSSMAGYRGLASCPAYSASKAFVKAWGEALRGKLHTQNIKVSVICPGFIKTPLTDKNLFKMPLLMAAPKAAQIMKKGIEKNKAIIAFPAPLVFATWIMSCLPGCFLSAIQKHLPNKE